MSVLTSVPARLFESIALVMQTVSPLFDPGSSAFLAFKASMDDEIAAIASYSPDRITWIQLLCLSALLGTNGAMMPPFLQVNRSEKGLRLQFSDYQWEDIAFGQWSESFLDRFLPLIFTNKPRVSTLRALLDKFLPVFELLMLQTQQICDQQTKTVEAVSAGTWAATESATLEHIFLVISALPREKMEQFFMALQQYLPDDLEAQRHSGATVGVCSFFEQPGIDFDELTEKLRMYMGLYNSRKHPIVQHITASKTSDILMEYLQHPDVKSETLRHLQETIDELIDSRLLLFRGFSRCIERVLA